MIRSVPSLAAAAVLAVLGAAASAFAQAPQKYVATPIPAHLVPVQNPPGGAGDGPGHDLDWNTMDNSGGPLSGGSLLLEGTVGQADPGILSGGALELGGGFWALLAEPPACWANCDDSTQAPVLNIADFTCFLTRFAGGDPYANCDNSTQTPVLNVADFTCFLTKYAAGCP